MENKKTKDLPQIFDDLKKSEDSPAENSGAVSYQINFVIDQNKKDELLDKMLAKLKESNLKEGSTCKSCYSCGAKTCKCM